MRKVTVQVPSWFPKDLVTYAILFICALCFFSDLSFQPLCLFMDAHVVCVHWSLILTGFSHTCLPPQCTWSLLSPAPVLPFWGMLCFPDFLESFDAIMPMSVSCCTQSQSVFKNRKIPFAGTQIDQFSKKMIGMTNLTFCETICYTNKNNFQRKLAWNIMH